MFFDLGARSTRAYLVSYEKNANGIGFLLLNNNILEKGNVLNVVWDYQLSGNAIDQRLVSHFISKLTPEQQETAEKRPKSIEKLFREVRRVKEMLSANKEAVVKVIQ